MRCAYSRAVPRDVADAFTSPVDHVHHAVRVQGHGHRVVKPHAGRGAAPDVVAIIIGSSCNRFCKHDTPSYPGSFGQYCVPVLRTATVSTVLAGDTVHRR